MFKVAHCIFVYLEIVRATWTKLMNLEGYTYRLPISFLTLLTYSGSLAEFNRHHDLSNY